MEMPTGGWAVVIAALAGGVKLLFTYATTKIEQRKWQKKYEQVGPSEGQNPGFGPTPNPVPAPSHEVELQALRVKQVLIETELAEAQQALRRLRNSLDEAEKELARKAGELVIARAMYDELREQAEKLKLENRKIRTEAEINESRHHQLAAPVQQRSVRVPDANRHLLPVPGIQRGRKGHEPPG